MKDRPFSRSSTDVSARRTYELIDEPVGHDYRALIEAGRAEGGTGMLSIGGEQMSPLGRRIVEGLRPHLCAAPQQGAGGHLLRFTLEEEPAGLLLAATDRLYAWHRPALPDNLCIFRSDGSPWLVTIAAERLGYIELTQLERVRLGHQAPRLASVLAHEAAHDAVLATFERRFEERVEPLVHDLLAYAAPLTGTGEGRDSVADVLQVWVLSGDDLRVQVALEMIARLRMEELRPEVHRLLDRLDVEASVPVAVAANAVLSERWRARRRHLLETVLEQIDAGPSGPPRP